MAALAVGLTGVSVPGAVSVAASVASTAAAIFGPGAPLRAIVASTTTPAALVFSVIGFLMFSSLVQRRKPAASCIVFCARMARNVNRLVAWAGSGVGAACSSLRSPASRGRPRLTRLRQNVVLRLDRDGAAGWSTPER